MRSKTSSPIQIHFDRWKKPREAEPLTRLRDFLIFAFGIFANRLRGRLESNPAMRLKN
jgi:hypothetical protein